MDVTKGVTPDQEFIKIMYDELVALMGAEQSELIQVCCCMCPPSLPPFPLYSLPSFMSFVCKM